MEVELIEFAARLAVYKKKTDSKEDTNILGKTLERTEVPYLHAEDWEQADFFQFLLSLRLSLNIWLEMINR